MLRRPASFPGRLVTLGRKPFERISFQRSLRSLPSFQGAFVRCIVRGFPSKDGSERLIVMTSGHPQRMKIAIFLNAIYRHMAIFKVNPSWSLRPIPDLLHHPLKKAGGPNLWSRREGEESEATVRKSRRCLSVFSGSCILSPAKKLKVRRRGRPQGPHIGGGSHRLGRWGEPTGLVPEGAGGDPVDATTFLSEKLKTERYRRQDFRSGAMTFPDLVTRTPLATYFFFSAWAKTSLISSTKMNSMSLATILGMSIRSFLLGAGRIIFLMPAL